MTCRQLLRLETPEGIRGRLPPDARSQPSRFRHWYAYTIHSLVGPTSDPGLSEWWSGLRWQEQERYVFAFATVEQVEDVWGPQAAWPEGMEEDLRTIAVLPHAVVDGETQSVYLDALRLF